MPGETSPASTTFCAKSGCRGGESSSGSRLPGRPQHAAGALERARYKLKCEEAVPLEWTRHAQGRRLFNRESETAIIGRVAHKDHRALAAGCGKRMTYERAANTAAAAFVRNGHGSQKQSRLTGAAHDVPETGGAYNPLAVCRYEGEVVGRPLPISQALRTFQPAALAEGLVEQRLARRTSGGRSFLIETISAYSRPGATKRALRGVVCGDEGSRAGRLPRCQM